MDIKLKLLIFSILMSVSSLSFAVDSDGVGDNADAFPNNALYSVDSDSDGMPDEWETKYGLDPNDLSDATRDLDNDGATALDEFLAGTIDQRIQPLLDGALELIQNNVSEERRSIYKAQFNALEAILGNTETFVTVVKKTELIADVALVAVCELRPDDCAYSSVSDMISNLEEFSDQSHEYRFIEVNVDNSIKQVIFLDEFDQYLNERFRLAFQAFFRELVKRKAPESDSIPKWWADGQEEYLMKMLESNMSLGEPFGDFHKRISSSISGLVNDLAPLSVLESRYKDISISAIIKLVYDYGMKAVFLDFYEKFSSGSTFDEVFQTQFGIDSQQFSESLELSTKEGLDLSLLQEPNDIIDGLEEPWRSNNLSARSLFDLAPFKRLISLPYNRAESCPYSLLMESHEFGDFNGDGYEDLIFTLDENNYWGQSADRFCSSPTRVLAIYGSADSSNPVAVVVDDTTLGGRDTVVADINNDGADDLLVTGAGHKNDSYPADSPSISSLSLYLGGETGLIKQTSTFENQTVLDLDDMTAEFGTYGDIDGDDIPEFFLFGNGKNINSGANVGWPVPILIDCDETCKAIHPNGFDINARPDYRGISIYNGALVDLDGDHDLDILINVEQNPNYASEQPFISKRYAHTAYFQSDNKFDMASAPVELDMGFRLDENTIAPIPDDNRVLDMNATHYWESELVDLLEDEEVELVVLENNQFHVENARFLISIYTRDAITNQFRLSEHQPQDTEVSHDQNFQFRDLDGDSKFDIVSTLTPSVKEVISLHRNLNPGWVLSTKTFRNFMQENNCNRIYTPDLDSDGNLDVIVFCNRSDGVHIYFGENMLPADRDNDSVPDINDAYPLIPIGAFVDTDSDGAPDSCDEICIEMGLSADSDDDGDGVADSDDAFPLDSAESSDSDGDGLGDNADAFPNDSSETVDSDSDGVGDNADAFPNDPTESADTDSDGVGDNSDAFPNDESEAVDSDSDGTGDNSDAFPQNALYSKDSDSDGMPDEWESRYGLDPNDPSDAASDQDNDGVTAFDEFLAGTIPSGSLDIDGNENYDALTDGLLLLRGMFGLDGSALVTGTIASDAVYTESVDIESRIATLSELADIDGNGDIDALTDGLLTLRYLFGLQGDTLINGVVAGDATRTTAEEIEAHLETLMPAL
jgi:hypothetical protein